VTVTVTCLSPPARSRRGLPGRVVRHPAGFLSSELAWAPDGNAFSACFVTGKGTVIEIRPLGGTGLSGEGLCFPAWAKSGLAAARLEPVSVEFAGETVLDAEDVGQLLHPLPDGSRHEVTALAAGPGDRLAVALAVVSGGGPVAEPGVLAVLAPGGIVERTFRLGPDERVQAIRFAPDGGGLWWADARGAQTTAFTLEGEAVDALPPTRWLAWSPSGRYVALAGEDGIEIRTWPRGDTVGTLPIVPNDLSWTMAP
jgi:hypothetical protein